ncbi:signal peptide peptidase SppA [Thorsellia kenyensis]|uniref:Signal peptide peptidase SppA n=1 Tax=Thorsellia kenyensis TaxID=1549888 RepID=A0ABV6CDX0_9GAMM
MWRLLKKTPRFTWLTLRYSRETFWNILFIILFISLFTALFKDNSIKPKNSALLLNIEGLLVDNPSSENALKASIEEFLGNDTSKYKENSVFEFINKIEQAKDDPEITGLVIALNQFYGANNANLEALGEAIATFKQTGKPIIAFADNLNQQSYYLASFANEIHITPFGHVDIHGIGTSNVYFKSLLETLGVNTHIFRVGTHKSAVEPYIRDDMSPEAKAMTTRFLSLLWQNYLETVSHNRGLDSTTQFFKDTKTLITSLENANGDMAKMALNNKWIDKLSSRKQIQDRIDSIFGTQEMSFISIYDYELEDSSDAFLTSPNIAIIHIEGPIVDGLSGPGFTGSETISEQIFDAKMDENIAALVLRVNSPGGSVTAAELIYSELMEFKATKRPIIASFGGVAASGGYWVAMPADHIFANKNTLTGSIGIFGIIQTFEETLSKIGVYSSSVATTEFGAGSITEPLSDDFKSLIQLNINHGYDRFLTIVSESRELPIEAVDKVAQGQVWVAQDALNHKLIDKIGNLADAIDFAAKLANVEKPNIKWFQVKPTFMEAFMLNMNMAFDNKLNAFIPERFKPYLQELSIQEVLMQNTTHGIGNIQTFAICEVCEVK